MKRVSLTNHGQAIGFGLALGILLVVPSRGLLAESNAKDVVNWSSEVGIQRLETSKHKVDFFPLANHFESQTNKVFCGPASAAIVLNALRVRDGKTSIAVDESLLDLADRKFLPDISGWSPLFPRYSQTTVFIGSPKKRIEVLGKPIEIQGETKNDYGLQLHQLGAMLGAHDVQVLTRVVSDDLSTKIIRNEMIANLARPGDYVLVNYARKVVGQEGGGHISPVGAYHKESDSFLVMDVNSSKADWAWIKASVLIDAMRTEDTIQNRGYILVSERDSSEVAD